MQTETPSPSLDETTPPEPGAPASPDASPRRVFWGLRARILFWSIASLAVAVVAGVLVVRQASLVQLDNRINDALVQEADELRSLSGGRDPLTGERFNDDVRRIFEVFLDRNVPNRNETYLAFVDGRLIARREAVARSYGLTEQADLMARWAGLETSDRGRIDTAAGTVEYLAVPVDVAGDVRGVFVVAYFRDLEAAQVSSAVNGAIEVGLIILLIGSIIAWRIAESVLRPVRAVTTTAKRITTGADLTQRLPVMGRDELAELSSTFNDMLDDLEEAFEAQQRFVDDAGHELRTPITVIRGHLDLMGDDPEERRATLALIDDELGRMHRIVNDLLILAKAERADFLRLGPVDLAELTEEVHAKAEALGDRDWRLGGVARGIVIADRQRLTQAVMQLAQNAVQHTVPGDAIEIGSRVLGGEAELWVRDTGEGIAPDEVDRIFDRFARGGRRRASDGAGLGLSIVRAIAEAHHGRVGVESEPGRGSRFAIVVPVDQPPGAPEAVP
ncbi:MAG TPA: HAMP domain-containing sensor histidine kinase [Actinomycetota bacterium]|nr:HAMP domain-containing sensor histidine kinase [Actinomycetota bacterium]